MHTLTQPDTRPRRLGPWLLIVTALVGLGCDDAPGPRTLDAAAEDASTDGAVTGPDDLALSVFMRGDAIYVHVAGATIYDRSCSGGPGLDKQDGDAWVAPQDDRYPDWQNPGYYLDGVFVGPSSNEGCDVVQCSEIPAEVFVARALEYVKVGEQPAPADAPTATSPAPVIERRPLRGQKLRITFLYSRTERCDDTQTATLLLDLPARGVCCPVGTDGCSSEGPGGGWAPSLDACAPYSIEYDGYSVARQDPWD